MAQVVINTKQAPLLWAVVRRFGLASLLAVLIFLPYTLLQLFWGGLVVNMGAGIGSPGGGRDVFYDSAPWLALLVAACFTFLMAVKLLRDRHLVARWRAALLLLLIFLLLSACVLWQTPFVPTPIISDYYLAAGLILMMSIYPCFFAALASAFLCERRYQDGIEQKTGWLFIPLSIPAALAGSAFCWLAITSGLSNDARYWQGYAPPPYSPLIAALYTFPTLLGASLVGGFLGMCLYRWFHRAFSRPAEPGLLAEMAERSASLGEPAPSSASAMRANWPAISWDVLWRLGLAGLISLIITGILLHMDIIFGIYDLPAQPFFGCFLIGFELYYHPGNWLIPPFLVSSLPVRMLFAAFISFTFLPFLMPLPGVLADRSLWKKHAILPALGIVLIFLGMAIGAMDLLLGLLHSLISFWPVGAGSALITAQQLSVPQVPLRCWPPLRWARVTTSPASGGSASSGC